MCHAACATADRCEWPLSPPHNPLLVAHTSDPDLALFPAIRLEQQSLPSLPAAFSQLYSSFPFPVQCPLNNPEMVMRGARALRLWSSFTTVPHCVAKVKPRLNWPSGQCPNTDVNWERKALQVESELTLLLLLLITHRPAQWCNGKGKMYELIIGQREGAGRECLKWSYNKSVLLINILHKNYKCRQNQ